MANEFKEFSKLVSEQHSELAHITRNLAQLSNPGESPLDLDIEGLDRMALTPKQVVDIVLNQGQEDESIRSLMMIGNCIDKMKITMALLKAQETLAWLAETEKAQEARDCLLEDNTMMGPLSEQLATLQQRHEAGDFPAKLDRESCFEHFHAVVDEYATFMKTPVAGHLQAAQDFKKAGSVQSLVETIYELRLDYLDNVIGDSATILDSMSAKLREAGTIHIAIDEGVIPDSAFVRQQIAERLGYCRQTLPNATENLAAISRFMSKLYEMGDDDWGTKNFEVREYQPVALNTLPLITP